MDGLDADVVLVYIAKMGQEELVGGAILAAHRVIVRLKKERGALEERAHALCG